MPITLRFIFLLLTLLLIQFQRGPPPFPDSPRITASNAPSLSLSSTLDATVRQVSFSSDGGRVAVAAQDGDADYVIDVYDMPTREAILSISGRMDFFHNLVWSPNSSRIAVISGRTTGGGVEERSVKLYTIASGSDSQPYHFGASDAWISDYIYPDPDGLLQSYPVDLMWNSSGELIAIAFFDRLVVYDVVLNAELTSIALRGIYDVEWSPDGRYIITKSDRSGIQLWQVSHDS